MSDQLRSQSSSSVLIFSKVVAALASGSIMTSATGLIGCSKYELAKSDTSLSDRNSNGGNGSEAQVAKEPLGLNLCKDQNSACQKFELKLPAQSVSFYMKPGGEAFKVLNQALPNVISAKSDEKGLTLTVNLPEKSSNEDIEIEIKKEAGVSDVTLSEIQSSIIETFNSSVSSSAGGELYVYAQKSETRPLNPRVKVTFIKISEAVRTAAAARKFENDPASLSASLGQTSVRGAYQEVVIRPIMVPIDYLSKYEKDQLSRNQEDRIKYPTLTLGFAVRAYFQDGVLKPSPMGSGGSTQVDESKPYCFILARVPTPEQNASHISIGGTITLVTGTWSFGPVNSDGTLAPNFSQSASLGLQGTGAESYSVPGKGFNKFGNGGRDSKRLISITCTSKRREMNVHTMISSIGPFDVAVGYPRANAVEAYLDEKNGIDPNLGMIHYKTKRLDLAVGSKITVLKDIESPAKSDEVATFQGRRVVGGNIDLNGGPLCLIANHLKAGTKLTLQKSRPKTIQLGEDTPVVFGAVFSTDPTDRDGKGDIAVNVVPNMIDAPAKIRANPSLLDASAIADCFGDFVSIEN